jgi:cell division protease FtsH
MGAKRVRDLFSEARQKTPCIIFIDEIDTIGKKRSNSNSFSGGFSGNDEREQTLNQLLSELDGFNNNDGILILASTNRKDILDPALIRPGRFDRIINIPLPDLTSRKQIINLYLKNKKTTPNIDVDLIAELTDGYSGAELKNLINEASILAVRQGLETIGINELSNAIEKSIVGLIKNTDTRVPETKLRVSIHEVGHSFLTMYYSKYFDLQKISIKSTYSGAGGYTLFTEKSKYKDGGLYTKDLLNKRLIINMGGKAAESIWFGDEHVSLGATQDLKQSNLLARKMIGLFGMGNTLETFYNDDIDNQINLVQNSNKFSEKTKETFDTESMNLVSDAYLKAKEILKKNKLICEKMSNLLLEKQVLNSNDLNEFVKNITFEN